MVAPLAEADRRTTPPNLPTEGHLGRAGDPVEGRDPDIVFDTDELGGVDVADHLGPAGDPAEGA